mmetsp:Transcript_52967/g.113105  ORF Transcript_52967/g.113105 Transcript_52967/m.113105 type:complete len:212 (+) Transcript_52967:1413-2048(+)
MAGFRKGVLFSSALSSTLGGSAGSGSFMVSSSGSGSVSLSSSIAGFSSSLVSASGGAWPKAAAAASAAFFAASSCCRFKRLAALSWRRCCCSISRWRFMANLFCCSSACCFLKSASDFSCFSWSISSWVLALKSSEGLPITTTATLLKWGCWNFFSKACRSSLIKLLLTSMTTKLRSMVGAMHFSTSKMERSSIAGTPNCMPGLSLEDFQS